MDGLSSSVLAPRPFSRWLPGGVLAVLLVAGVDAAIAGELALAASLAVVTLLVALAGRSGDTLAVAGVAVVAGVVSGAWNGFGLSWGYALFAITAGAIMSLLVALVRANAVITDRRLALLRDLLGLADRPQDVAQLVDRIARPCWCPRSRTRPRSTPAGSGWPHAVRTAPRSTGSTCR